MELLPVLSAWRRRRILIAIGALLALAIAFKLGSGATSTSGRAWSQVMFDTPKSQLVTPAPLGVETLGWRGGLATTLLETLPERRKIATALGIKLEELRILDPVLAVPTQPASLPKKASKSAFAGAEAYVLIPTLDPRFPLVRLEGNAPTADEAARLVRIATGLLEQQSASAENRLLQPIEFSNDGVFQKRTIRTGGGPAMAIGAALFFFFAWTGTVLLVTLLVDRWRTRAPVPRKISGPADVDFA